MLRRSPLLEMLSEAELHVLAELSRVRRFGAGELVLGEGDAGDALFVLAQGEVDVVVRTVPGAAGRSLTARGRPTYGTASMQVPESPR